MRTRRVPGIFNGSIDRFCGVLNRLRPARKSLDEDAEEMFTAVRAIEQKLYRQMEYEERSLFPFVTGVVPRLNGLVQTLLEENEDLRRLVNDLKMDLETLRAREAAQKKLVQKIRSEGAYLSCLLRSHLSLQEKCIYDTVPRQLKPHERMSFDKVRSMAGKALGKGREHGTNDRTSAVTSSVL